MTSYKEYKLADKVRAEAKREKCLCVEKVILYSVCGTCGKRSATVIKGEDTHKPIIPCEFVCACKNDAY